MLTSSIRAALILVVLVFAGPASRAAGDPLRARAVEALRTAASYYVEHVATHGGYVYHYDLDDGTRWGEGEATVDQIWVQPPGTPTVGMAYLDAYGATGERFYLDAATDAALALAYGQLKSGGWTNSIDFDPDGQRVSDYRNGKGRGRNVSSLDDGQSQSALMLMIRADRAHEFRHEQISEIARIGLDALLAAQFPNGGFPQIWRGPVGERPVIPARFPDGDWQHAKRIKNYWDMYTLNDNVCGYVAQVLVLAHETYDDPRYLAALRKLGDFLVLAQLPEPQRGWAQQYDEAMHPIWARRFEPPAIASDETQEAIATLLTIASVTGDDKYLEPLPAALRYLQRSTLEDGRLARYYELETNRPLYMRRRGRDYEPTFSDENLPGNYAWKVESRIDELRQRLRRVQRGIAEPRPRVPVSDVRRVLRELDDQGRWVSIYDGGRLVGQPIFEPGDRYLCSQRFSENVSLLSRFIAERED